MLKIKNNIDLKELEKFGFVIADNYTQRNWTHVLYDYGVVKIWVDRERVLHFNQPRLEQFDLIYKMHDLLEITDKSNLKMLSRGALLEENKKLKQRLYEMTTKFN